MSQESTTIVIPQQRGITPIDPDHSSTDERIEQERQDRVDAPDLLAYVKKTCEHIKRQRESDWQRILDSQARAVAYYDDRQYGTVREGVFVDARREPGDIRPVDNQYKIQVDKLLMEFSRAFPDIQVTAADRNDTPKVEAAKFAQARVNAARRQLLKNSDRLCEGQALLLKTITWRYVYWNGQAPDSPMERRPKQSVKTLGRTRSLVSCKMCGGPMKPVPGTEPAATADDTQTDGYRYNGEGEQPAASEEPKSPEMRCINCGSNRQKVVEVSGQPQPVVEGYEEVRGGRVESRHIDPTMVRISLTARRNVADSPFLWYHQNVARCILESAYVGMKIKSAGGLPNMADRYKTDAENTPSNTMESGWSQSNDNSEYQGGGDQFEECPFDLFWIDPVVYASHPGFKREQRLMGGRILPAGVKPITMFPDGMCIAINADQVLDVYGENKNRKWMFCVYGIREHALHGAGTNNLLGPQDTRNDLKSFLIANVYYNCGRREFIRNGAFTGNRLPAINEAAIVNDVPDDKPVRGWAHTTAEGSPLPSQAVELYQSEGGSLSEGAGTASLDTKGTAFYSATKTAAGVNAMRDMAVGRMGPNLMLLTEMEEEWSYVVLELEKDNFTEERFMRMANQSVTADDTDGSITFSAAGIRAFRECNPRVDFEIKAVQGSWMPRTEGERQAKFSAFIEVAGQISKALGPGDPRGEELIAKAAAVYGVTDVDVGGWTSSETVAAARIRAFAKTVQTYEKRGKKQPSRELVEQVINSTPECYIDYEMDNHPLFIAFYDQWWPSDEGTSCSPLLRAVIKAQRILHRMGIVYKAQNTAKDKIAADAPNAIAAAETAKEAAAETPPPDPKAKITESINYKDAEPSVRKQIVEAAGMDSSGMDADHAAAGSGDGTEEAEATSAIAVQEHKAELESGLAREKSELKKSEVAQDHALDEERAQADHLRKLAEQQQQNQHAAGIKGAELVHKSVESASDRQHKSELSESEREAERQRMEAEQKAAATTGKKK